MKSFTNLALTAIALFAASALVQAAPVAENWENSCMKCHGSTGKGDTKTGKKLLVKDYSDPKVQEAMSDEVIIRVTAEGVIDEKTGKERMRGFKDEFSPEEIAAFVPFIRAFRRE